MQAFGFAAVSKINVAKRIAFNNSIISRKITLIISEEDYGDDWNEELKNFGQRVATMGGDPYPNFRKEALKPKVRRYEQNKRKGGKISNYKVRSLVDFIHFKRAHKYQ